MNYEEELEKVEKEESDAWKKLDKNADRFDYAYACGKKEGLELGFKLAKEQLDGRTREGKKYRETVGGEDE